MAGADSYPLGSKRKRLALAPAMLIVSACVSTPKSPVSPTWCDPSFRVGVYLNHQVPTAKAFEMLHEAGVNFVWINLKNYRTMAKFEHLSALAARYRIDIYVQLFARLDADEPDDVARARIRAAVRFINRQPHKSVVVGYGIADEPELNFPVDEHPEVAARAARFIELVKSSDPRRRTLTTRYGTRWHDFRTDEVWCNVFGADAEDADLLAGMWRVVRAAGYPSFVALAAGQSPQQLKDEPSPDQPPTTSGNEERSNLASADIREHYIYQYALSAYLAGAEGVVFYIFDGVPEDRTWSLVDSAGADIAGKWEGLQAAIKDIRDMARHQSGSPRTYSSVPRRISMPTSK
ncbi:MAG TPA: hypothetical protein VGM03_06065 [Phycisphaerae bacterium]|jgi:hypothetical protein